MNCNVCPHMRKIKAALAPCQNCDAGHLHGQRTIDNQPDNDVDSALKDRVIVQQSDAATNLPSDIENNLRQFLASLFALDPIKFLLVRHIALGGSYSAFRKDLRGLVHRIIDRDYDLSEQSKNFRQIAHCWGLDILLTLPQFAAIKPSGDAGRYSGGRKAPTARSTN